MLTLANTINTCAIIESLIYRASAEKCLSREMVSDIANVIILFHLRQITGGYITQPPCGQNGAMKL